MAMKRAKANKNRGEKTKFLKNKSKKKFYLSEVLYKGQNHKKTTKKKKINKISLFIKKIKQIL